MNYHAQLLAAGVSPEEATRYYVFDEQQRIENFERYSRQSASVNESEPHNEQ